VCPWLFVQSRHLGRRHANGRLRDAPLHWTRSRRDCSGWRTAAGEWPDAESRRSQAPLALKPQSDQALPGARQCPLGKRGRHVA
jgi:hypothetical protein